jgi:hypothetical protein
MARRRSGGRRSSGKARAPGTARTAGKARAPGKARKPARKSSGGLGRRLSRWPRRARTTVRTLRRLPAPFGFIALVGLLALLAFGVNLAVQVARKPTELFYPVDDVLAKAPAQTWAAYGDLFEAHSTARISPELLAALAQVESAGNPVARTYWRFALTGRLFEIWRPASSSVGLYQLTDGTFDQARRLCVHDHVVVDDGPWDAPRSCWFNALYARTVPTHAIEMTSAYLDRSAAAILAGSGRRDASPRQLRQLAAVIHLCGAGAARQFARRGFALGTGQLCGTHRLDDYVGRVEAHEATFSRLRGKAARAAPGG